MIQMRLSLGSQLSVRCPLPDAVEGAPRQWRRLRRLTVGRDMAAEGVRKRSSKHVLRRAANARHHVHCPADTGVDRGVLLADFTR